MDLERIAVAVREREGWEAVDIGFAMVRKWWRPVFGAWLVVVWPIAALINLVFTDFPWIAFLVIWWLKPLFDRLPLAITSRAFFGEAVGPWQLLRNSRHLLGRGLLAALTFRRFSPWRSYVLPVDQLEELRGATRTQRIRVLAEMSSGMGIFVTLAAFAFELSIYLAGFVLILLFSPWEVMSPGSASELAESNAPLLINAFQVLAMTLIEPFYVGAGFGLYINRRVLLEGWDIELGLKKLNQRLDTLRRPPGSLTATLLALCALALPRPSPAQMPEGTLSAQWIPAVVHTEAPPDLPKIIHEILAEPDFQTKEMREVWQMRDQAESTDLDLGDFGEFGFLASVGRLLATVLFWTTVAVVAALLIYLVITFLRRRGSEGKRPHRPPRQKPDVLFGLDLRPESLPPDILAAVRQAWRTGQPAAALSLLYRGALAHVVERLSVDLPNSATEGECIRIVHEGLEQPLALDFESLTRVWQRAAYAAHLPTSIVFDQLCTTWRHHLGRAQ